MISTSSSDFRRLLAGETASLFGSQVTVLALPLTAVLTLDVSAAGLGALNAARFAPFLLVTLVAGVLVDRRRRRPVLVAANLGRAVLLVLVPLAAWQGLLTLELLCAVAFGVGVLGVFFEVAFWAFVPTLVGREAATRANGRLVACASAAEIGGPGLGGLLVQVVTAPFALVVDAVSFVIAAVSLGRIRFREPEREPTQDPAGLGREIGDGLRFVFGNRVLRAFAGEAATFNVFETAFMIVFVLYATRDLGIGAGLLGATIATASAGVLVGALLAERVGRAIGLGPAIAVAMVLGCVPFLLVPLGGGQLAVIALGFLLAGVGIGVSNVHVVSVRQRLTPDALLGRMTASYRFVVYGTIPLGALLGGVLGELLPLGEALVVTAAGIAVAPLWVLLSPVPRLPRHGIPFPAAAA